MAQDKKVYDTTKYGFNPNMITSVVSLDWINAGVEDMADLMRIQMLGMSIEVIAINNLDNLTVENIKASQGYRTTIYDIHIPDQYLVDLINRIKK